MLKELTQNAAQYSELSRLLWKYGHFDLAGGIGLVDPGDAKKSAAPDAKPTPEALAEDIEKLGPAYIKLAQIASTRQDMIPVPYAVALARLQDHTEPVAAETIRATIEEELGAKVGHLFETFDDHPFASASLGQVHRATLRDGRAVVVKVQRPHVRQDAQKQLRGLREIAKVVDAKTEVGRRFRFETLVGAVEYAMSIELDYRREAANLRLLDEHLTQFPHMCVPQPIEDMVSQRVLVMEFFEGTSLETVSGAVLAEIDGESLGLEIVQSYLRQILIDGLFHADPHPGNLILTQHHQIGLLDGGMVVSVSPGLRRRIASFLLAISENEGEEAASVAEQLGSCEEDFDMDAFRVEAARVVVESSGLSETTSMGQTVIRFLNAAGKHGLLLPFELILLSKALLQLESTLRRLAPRLDAKQVIRQYATELLRERAGEQISLGRITQTALESAELASALPKRLNRITEMMAENAFRVKVDAIDERELIRGVHRVANRITAGLVTSALIVGASLMMQIDAGPTFLGFPLLATIFFVLATLNGFYLVWLALYHDRG